MSNLPVSIVVTDHQGDALKSHRQVPREIDISIKKWASQSAFLQYSYILLVAITIIAPLMVSAFSKDLMDYQIKLISCLGAVAAGCLAIFRLLQKANEMRMAYVELVSLKLKYENTDKLDLNKLIEEYRRLAMTVVQIYEDKGGGRKDSLK